MKDKTTQAVRKVSKRGDAASDRARLATFALRPFGARRSDLDVNLASSNAPDAITAVIGSCEEPSGTEARIEQIWNMPISARIARLLEIVALTQETKSLSAVLQCKAAACRKSIEIELPIQRLLELRPEEGRQSFLDCSIGQRAFRFRRPVGRDQRIWRNTRFQNPEDAYACMARTLLTAPSGDISWDASLLEKIGAAFEEFDALAAFRVECVCAHCGHAASLPVDLQAACLDRLREVQRELIHHIGRLASAYGWTEEDIVSIPLWRRQCYLRLIEGGGSA